jgi:HTH-type transcriptional regulator, competence development regulator
MPQSALGFLLRDLRDERKLSLRETAQLADVDHAYVYRLESGDKESPSNEVLTKLARALKAPRRENEMLRYIAAHPETEPGLVAHVRQDPTVTYRIFAAAASAAYRGAARPDYATRIDRIRRILGEEDEDG